MAAHTEAHEGHAHATSGKYIQIALILFTLTALEVALYELCYGSLKAGMPGMATTLEPYFVEVLLVLSAFKFWYVAMFYMHLKFDIKVLSWVFGFSLVIATVVIVALFVLFAYNKGLWWMGAPW